MNFAFDLERTIDAYPEQFRAIAHGLMLQGHGVYIVTGLFPGATLQLRLAQLNAVDWMPGRDYNELITCSGDTPSQVGQSKARALERISAVMFFDDRLDFIREIFPSTPCMWVANTASPGLQK
jgi:hypothetical protein